jgi:hypothetical protein
MGKTRKLNTKRNNKKSKKNKKKGRNSNNVKRIVVKKILTDEETNKLQGTLLPKGYYKKIIRENVDVFTEDGDVLIRFRKNVLPQKNVNNAYDALKEFARKKTSTRGMAGGENGKIKLVQNNNLIMSNIIGYFDTLGIKQKRAFRISGMKKPVCRPTRFTGLFPDKMEQCIPLIKDIDKQYKKLFPKHHERQYKAAQSTKYVIDNTAFSTITLNMNFQTACHHDRGDFKEGFGNLVVIEKGGYKGGYVGFPQYGIAVDIRTGDFLGMDVHQIHGNEPIELNDDKSERLSLVSYLRQGIFEKCQNEPYYPYSYFQKASEITAELLKDDPNVKKPGPKKGFKRNK